LHEQKNGMSAISVDIERINSKVVVAVGRLLHRACLVDLKLVVQVPRGEGVFLGSGVGCALAKLLHHLFHYLRMHGHVLRRSSNAFWTALTCEPILGNSRNCGKSADTLPLDAACPVGLLSQKNGKADAVKNLPVSIFRPCH
jgi:hypothetical protein